MLVLRRNDPGPTPQNTRNPAIDRSTPSLPPLRGPGGSVVSVHLPQSIRLSRSGLLAELTADDLTSSGVVLSIGLPEVGMAEQSHVEVEDPTFLLHDYIRRMGSILTATAPGLFHNAAPDSVLHLGAGALTLPRWVEQRWPAVRQTVVDYEPELVDFVLEHLPMAEAPESIVADAAEVLTGELKDRRFDVVVVDLFNSELAPEHLISPAFFDQVRQRITAGGLMLLNFGDDADMSFARGLVGTLLNTLDDPEAALLSAPDAVMRAQEEGNLVFAARPHGRFTPEQLRRIWAAGPHPGEVLSGESLTSWSRVNI